MDGANGFSPEEVLHYNRKSSTGPLHPVPAPSGAGAAPGGPAPPAPDGRGVLLAARSVRTSSLAAIQEGADEAPGQGGAKAPVAPHVRCRASWEPLLAPRGSVGLLWYACKSYGTCGCAWCAVPVHTACPNRSLPFAAYLGAKIKLKTRVQS